MDQPRGSIST